MSTDGKTLLVIPCLRESKRIGVFLDQLCPELERIGDVDLLVVDDGSGAEEQARMTALLQSYQSRYPFVLPLFALAHNLGKGGAIYAAWEQKHGDAGWLAFVDADGSCPASETTRLITLAREHPTPEALFASRVRMLGMHIRRHWYRHFIGRIYATVVSETLHILVYDSQCGLKIVPRLIWQDIEPFLTVRGFAFDVELLAGLLDAGCSVREVPIDWSETPGGKVRLFTDSFKMFRDIIRIHRHRRTSRWASAMNAARLRHEKPAP